MQNAAIVDAVWTSFGKQNGTFRGTHPQDLAAEPLRALEARSDLDPATAAEESSTGVSRRSTSRG